MIYPLGSLLRRSEDGIEGKSGSLRRDVDYHGGGLHTKVDVQRKAITISHGGQALKSEKVCRLIHPFVGVPPKA